MSRVGRGSVSEKGDASEGAEDGQTSRISVKGGKKSAKGAQDKDSAEAVCGGGFSKVCGKTLKDADCVRCDICQGWFHPGCQKLSPPAFMALCQYEFFWGCDVCKVKLPDIIEAGKSSIELKNKLEEVQESIVESQQSLKAHMDKVTAQLSSQSVTQDAMSEKIRKLETCMTGISTSVAGEVGSKKKLETSLKNVVKEEVKMIKEGVSEVISTLGKESKDGRDSRGGAGANQMPNEVAKSVRECMEQEKRRRNIVVHNLKEPDSDLSVEERNMHDKMAFQEMCKDTMRLNTRVERTYRIGRATGGRSRLLIVAMEEEATKWEVLRMAKNLRDVEKYSNIYVTPDLTPEEQARDKALREELKRRRLAGEVVEIRRGRIIRKQGQEKKQMTGNRNYETQNEENRVTETGNVETIPKRVE